jgi:hypothetical protein
MAAQRWHVATQLTTPEQRESDLPFPAVKRKLRSPSVVNEPLDGVALELGLPKHITQRALRRTFDDLARPPSVNDVVTRSIAGHLTERMQHHYSTVNGGQQGAALAKVISLFASPSGEWPVALLEWERPLTNLVSTKQERPGLPGVRWSGRRDCSFLYESGAERTKSAKPDEHTGRQKP